MKLAVFVDQVYWFDGNVYSTDEAYTLFPASFTSAFDEVVFIGRLAPTPGRKPYTLDDPAVTVCLLPYYDSVYNVWKDGRRLYAEIRAIIQSHASDWDLVCVCGPNPVGQLVAQICVQAGCPVFLVVRQNLVRQMRFVNRGIKRIVAVLVAIWLEWHFKRLARGKTVFAVGQEMTDAYRTKTTRSHLHFPCLVTDAQMVAFAAVLAHREPNRLLCVGRLSPEKGYRYLLAALSSVRTRGGRCFLDIVGSGPEEQALQAQVSALGLVDSVIFHGYLPYGPELFALYQRSTALVVPSLSEGFPQVISEALCLGLPTIASAVGGIPAFLTHGETALLVSPGDVSALTIAIEQILQSSNLRERLRDNGRALMRNQTLEANRDRMVQVIQHEVLATH